MPLFTNTPDASTTEKGKVKLAQDLGGTADLPTVVSLSLSADTAINHKLTTVTDPTNPQDVATKAYVDNAASGAGLSNKGASRLATAAALPSNLYNNGASGVGATLTGVSVGALSVDGVVVALNDRIVVKDEVSTARNGIYTVTTLGTALVVYVLTRATNMDSTSEIGQAYSFVTSGTVNASTSWNVNAGTYTVGTTAITWNQFSAAPTLTGGDGITVTGGLIDADVDNSTVAIVSNQIAVKTGGITGTQLEDIVVGASVGDATHIPVITYDDNGRVTSTTTATISSGTQRTFAYFIG